MTFAHTDKDSSQSVAHSRSWEGVGRIELVSVQSVRIVGEMSTGTLSTFRALALTTIWLSGQKDHGQGSWSALLISFYPQALCRTT